MIITEPNDFAAEIHDRMPVFLTEQQFAPWLSGEARSSGEVVARHDPRPEPHSDRERF